MADRPRPGTPQFRILLLRKLKNVFPACEARIVDVPGGVSFQLLDAKGQTRMKPVTIYAHHSDALTTSKLRWLIESAKGSHEDHLDP